MTRFRFRSRQLRGRRPVTRIGRSGAATGGESSTSFVWESKLEVDEKVMVERFALEAIGTVKLRTARGRDYQGRAFRPYSAQHAAARTARGLAPRPVDLRMTGSMLGSLGLRKVRHTANGLLVTISPDASNSTGIPNNLKARYLEQNGRIFMALSSRELANIGARMGKAGILKSVKVRGNRS